MTTWFICICLALGCVAQFEDSGSPELPGMPGMPEVEAEGCVSLRNSDQFTIFENMARIRSLKSLHRVVQHDEELQTLLSKETGNFTFFLPTLRAMRRFFRYLNWQGKRITHKFLLNTLRYHLLNETMFSSNFSVGSNMMHTLMNNESFVNLNGESQVINVLKRFPGHLKVAFGPPNWKISTARVIKANVCCKNGVMHMVDTVFRMPEYTSNILSDTGAMAMLSSISSAGLNSVFDSASNITMFVPLNHALDALLSSGNIDTAKLKDVLLGHVAHGAYYKKSFGADVVKLKMLNGKEASLEYEDHTFKIGGAKVLLSDVIVRNGIIHVVDRIMRTA